MPKIDNPLHQFLVDTVNTGLEKRGWTHKDLSRESGVSTFTVGNMLKGHRSGQIENWTKFLDAIDERPEFWVTSGRTR